MAGEGLGRLFDLEHQISDGSGSVHPVSLINAAGVEFLCSVPGGGADTFTLKSGVIRTGTFTALAVITDYYAKATLDGTSQWVKQMQAAGSTLAISGGQVVFYVDAADLPSAANYVEVAPAGSGLVTAIVHDLAIQRGPANLAALNS
jgi:hypothetical protein